MGRGRAKAKQQKVARDLKYHAQHTDLDALQRELAQNGGDSQYQGLDETGDATDDTDDAADSDDVAETDSAGDTDGYVDDRWASSR
jgi:hypothetical protein